MKLMKKYREIFFFAHQMLLKQTLTTKSIPKPFLGPFIWRNLKWNSFKLQFVTRKIWLTEISFKYPPNFLTPEGPLIVEVLHTPKRVPLIMQKLQFSFIEGQMQWKKNYWTVDQFPSWFWAFLSHLLMILIQNLSLSLKPSSFETEFGSKSLNWLNDESLFGNEKKFKEVNWTQKNPVCNLKHLETFWAEFGRFLAVLGQF